MNTFKAVLDQILNLFKWFVTVAPWEQALRVRLGKNITLLDAGVWVRIPFADRLYRQSIRKRFSTIPTQTLTTLDGKTITVSGQVGYSISNIEMLYNTLHHPEDAIQSEIQLLVTKFIVTHTLAECTPSGIESFVEEKLDLAKYGLSNVEYYLTDYAVVKTYRIIQGFPKDYTYGGDNLNTDKEDSNHNQV